MGDKGDSSKKQPQQSHHPKQQQQQQISSSPKSLPQAAAEEPISETRTIHHQQQQSPVVVVSGATPFISSPLYVSSGASSSPFEQQQQQQQQFETLNISSKRPRYSTGQWKLLPSPPSQQQQQHHHQKQMSAILPSESSPSPSPNPPQPLQTYAAAAAAAAAASSSSDTASSPRHSPMPLLSSGKYVSPVWKPNEMLWLARAWKAQYQGGGGGSEGSSSRTEQQQQGGGGELGGMSRGKTRADKDREVAEFLQRHGVNRDAKTAGTKWDNMLGEFRKVYEWERGGEREQVGKSYFRLSPYERKLHRLPASFDEEVFEELSQFMGSRMRSSSHGGGRGTASTFVTGGDDGRTASHAAVATVRALPLPPPRPFKDDDLPLSAARTTKQLGGNEGFFHGPNRGSLLGLDPHHHNVLDIQSPSSSSSSRELRRIGKIRMTWEECVSLWAEEGEVHRGRVRVQASSFLNADELTYFDESMVPCPMESFEDGPLRGFSVDRFVSGQQVKVFGRRKPSSSASSPPSSANTVSTVEYRDPSDYYVECLQQRTMSSLQQHSLPTLFELKRYLQDPPPQDLRFPLRKQVYDDLPQQSKQLFFTPSTQPPFFDSRTFLYDVVSPLIRSNPTSSSSSSSRDSFIPLWDDCVNRIISIFCNEPFILTRKPTAIATSTLQDQWPNVSGFVNNYCLWRGEETDQLREGQQDPSSTIVEKLLWTYADLPYILGYYAIGTKVTLCALSRSTQSEQGDTRIIRTDLQQLNLTTPSERIKALVPCFRIATLLPLLSKICNNSKALGIFTYSDFERFENGNGVVTEMTPNTCTRIFSEKRKWLAAKEVYEILKHRIPHAETLVECCENEMSLVFKPRGCRTKPSNIEELVEALKCVTKALVALHDLSFMHRDLGWEKVMRRSDSRERESEWFVCGFEEASGAPELNRRVRVGREGEWAPEMERGLHSVKVDVWGVGWLIRTCGLAIPKMVRELERMCMENNPEHRPTAADCYHHLLQLQSSLSQHHQPAGGLAHLI
ncbi:hypothetical protein PIB30_061029 [Stylosanthes scabra]|uniref:Protein kinase domain-containing protein n=1 Tax=Stylosanthes scabra TaxID=79078 RepID=A0ABU6XIY9_9FABA|nr:hypothetical protein [Stylosanthes scabra]